MMYVTKMVDLCNLSQSNMKHHYYVTLESGRSFVLKSSEDWYTAAYDAHEEAKLMDDYLIDVIPIEHEP